MMGAPPPTGTSFISLLFWSATYTFPASINRYAKGAIEAGPYTVTGAPPPAGNFLDNIIKRVGKI